MGVKGGDVDSITVQQEWAKGFTRRVEGKQVQADLAVFKVKAVILNILTESSNCIKLY